MTIISISIIINSPIESPLHSF